MDREIKEELQKQRDERIDIVRKELAWESEKQRISLEKLRKRSVIYVCNTSCMFVFMFLFLY